MSNPTFNTLALADLAARTQFSSRQSRAVTEALPGVDGLYVQPLGSGGRRIEVTGLLFRSSILPGLARGDALAAFAARERLADGRTVAAFVDADGTPYPNCMLTRLSHGPLRLACPAAGAYEAYLPVTAELLQLTP
jgi:hypothetical protein